MAQRSARKTGWKGAGPGVLCALAFLTGAGAGHAGTPIRGTAFVAELQTERLYRVDFRWDGASQLAVDPPQLVATTHAGGGVHFASDVVYVTGGGTVTRVELANASTTAVQTSNNANACVADPARDFLYCGWHFGLSRVPLRPFAAGSLVPLTGDDVNLTALVFTPAHGVFYSTGTEGIVGDFGSIDLGTGQTVRRQTHAFATGIAWDPFSQRILLANLGRAQLTDPANPAVAESQRDDSASQNYLSLNVTGQGHALGTLCCTDEARLVLLDYSHTADMASAQTLIASAVLPGLTQLSGEASFDFDRVFSSGFENGEL